MITMQIDVAQHRISSSVLEELGDKADKVLADATNRALAGMRTDGTKLIVAESGIIRKKVFSSFRIIKASSSGECQNARIDIIGNPLGLSKFKYKYKKPKKNKKGGSPGSLSVSIGQKNITFQHAFVAKMKSGHVGIFERQRGVITSSGREKLQEKFGPSIPQFASRKHITEKVQFKAQERFVNRFNQQAQRLLSKKGSR